MNVMFAGVLGGWEIILILAVVLILFGAKKLPELARGLGQGIKEFKKATNEVTSELSRSVEDDTYRPPQRPDYVEPKKLPDATTGAPNSAAVSSPKEVAAPTADHKG